MAEGIARGHDPRRGHVGDLGRVLTMGRFTYTVQDDQGETSTGTLEATDENEAISALQGKGYFILSIQPDRQDSGGIIASLLENRSRISQTDLAFFGEQ